MKPLAAYLASHAGLLAVLGLLAWSYDFDPSGLELVRRAIEQVAAARPVEDADA